MGVFVAQLLGQAHRTAGAHAAGADQNQGLLFVTHDLGELLAQLAGRDPSCSPVIIVTALSDVENRRKGLELGADDYVSKPLDLTELMLRVRSKLQLCHASRALKHERAELERKVASRTEQLRQSYEAIIHSLSMAATFRDNETGNHIRRTQFYVKTLAEKIQPHPRFSDQLDLRTTDLLFKSAPLHDIGKVGIPDAILLKPGPLSVEERAEMEKHAERGRRILEGSTSDVVRLAAEIAESHHERWEGGGYPRGLAGEAIPVSARITKICDVYDALRSARAYRGPWDRSMALEYMRDRAAALEAELVARDERIKRLEGDLKKARSGRVDVASVAAGAEQIGAVTVLAAEVEASDMDELLSITDRVKQSLGESAAVVLGAVLERLAGDLLHDLRGLRVVHRRLLGRKRTPWRRWWRASWRR